MAKSKSWSVKGIDGETRDLARDASQAAGMTIGAWIDQAILKAKSGALPEFGVTAVVPVVAPEASPGTVPVAPTNPEAGRTADGSTVAPTPALRPEPGNAPDTQAPSEPAPKPVAEPASALVAEPEDRAGGDVYDAPEDRPAGDGAWSSEATPLAPPPQRPSAIRYVILGILLLSLLAGGGWLFVEFFSTERPPPRQIVAGKKAPMPAPAEKAGRPADTTAPLPDEIRTGIEMAKAGDTKAQHDLGMLHLAGRFVKKDSTEAAKWFERAAVQGLANAQFNLGVLYERGEGVAQNDRLAFFWYQSAADQGLARAQHNLATAYAEGKGIAKNYTKAVEWFTKSASAGLGASQYSLAMIYERGLASGTPDLARARSWYEKAMAQGDAQASERLASIDARLAVSRPTTSAPTAPPAAAAATALKPVGRQEIREIQSLLARMNFDPGPADGQMGRRTADAIRLYQQFAGIEADGVPTEALLEDMRAVAGSISKDG
jgi:localization factor PodJL